MKRDFPEFPFIDHDTDWKHLRSLYREVEFVPRLMDPSELVALYQMAAGLHSNVECSGDVLELGTFCGCSAIAITAGLALKRNGSRLYTFDHGRWYNETVGIAASAFKRLDLNRQISQITDDYLVFFEKFEMFPTPFIFHDAVQNYDRVFGTLERFFPFIMNSGWFTVHDYNNSNMENVVKPVNDFIDSGQYEISVFKAASLICLQKRE